MHFKPNFFVACVRFGILRSHRPRAENIHASAYLFYIAIYRRVFYCFGNTCSRRNISRIVGNRSVFFGIEIADCRQKIFAFGLSSHSLAVIAVAQIYSVYGIGALALVFVERIIIRSVFGFEMISFGYRGVGSRRRTAVVFAVPINKSRVFDVFCHFVCARIMHACSVDAVVHTLFDYLGYARFVVVLVCVAIARGVRNRNQVVVSRIGVGITKLHAFFGYGVAVRPAFRRGLPRYFQKISMDVVFVVQNSSSGTVAHFCKQSAGVVIQINFAIIVVNFRRLFVFVLDLNRFINVVFEFRRRVNAIAGAVRRIFRERNGAAFLVEINVRAALCIKSADK